MRMYFFPTSILLFLAVGFGIVVDVEAQIVDPRPICEAIGTKSEGWYQSGIRVDFAACAGCLSYCAFDGLPQEGWYNWCDQSLITLDRCADALHQFTDVSVRHPLYTPIRHAVNLGVVEGYATKRGNQNVWEYRPNALINRAEFTKMIVTATENRERLAYCTKANFVDVHYAAWYIPSLCIAEEEGIIRGYPDGSFQPDRSINFAEAAMVFARAFDEFPITPVDSNPWYRGPIEVLAAQHAIPYSITSFEQKLTRGEMADILYRLQVFDLARTTRTYAELVSLSTPASSSAPSSSSASSASIALSSAMPVVASAPPASSVPLPRTRFPSHDGLFSVELPNHWQATQLDGTQVVIAQLDPRFAFYGPPVAEEPGVIIEQFNAQELQKPVTEGFFSFLRRTLLPPIDDTAIETVAFAGGTVHHLRFSAEDGRGAYYTFFIRGDDAVLLIFAAEDLTATDIVASFLWTSSSASSL